MSVTDDWRRSLLGGAVGSLALAASILVSLAGSAGRSDALAVSAPVVRQATASGSCGSDSGCVGVDLYGSTSKERRSLAPGESVSTTTRFDARGSGATGLVLTPSPCVATTADQQVVRPTVPGQNLCSVLRLALYRGTQAIGEPVFSGTLADFDTPRSFAVRGNPSFTFVVHLPASTTTAVQGQRVSQPLSWAFRR